MKSNEKVTAEQALWLKKLYQEIQKARGEDASNEAPRGMMQRIHQAFVEHIGVQISYRTVFSICKGYRWKSSYISKRRKLDGQAKNKPVRKVQRMEQGRRKDNKGD